MDTIQGTVSEVGHDYEGIYHVTIEATIPDNVVLIRFDLPQLGKDPHLNIGGRMSVEPTRLIATTVGEPAVKAGDPVKIKVFYQDDVILKDGQPVPIAEAYNLPDPNKPTHVVSMDAFASPQWAQQEKFTEVIRQLCVPCKEHGVYPVVGEQPLNVAKDRPLATGKLTVHCPNKECRFYVENYDPAKWNELMK